MGDSSWKSRPKLASAEISKKLGAKIKSYGKKNNIYNLTIELHGGEPLLMSKKKFSETIDILIEYSHPVKLDFVIQSNGLLLDSEWLAIFDKYSIPFSISLDGPPKYADKFRVDFQGRGTTVQVLKNLTILQTENRQIFDKLFSGILCVINSETKGREITEWFLNVGFKNFDFLLPDGNYVNPPFDSEEQKNAIGSFLKDSFLYWFNLGNPDIRIRYFEEIIKTRFGKKSGLDAIGGDLGKICVVESDGTIGCHDVLRICKSNITKDQLNLDNSELGRHSDFYNLKEIQEPCQKCKDCKYLKSCGGGYLPHRFDGKTFENPSIYCDILYDFFDFVDATLNVELNKENVL